MTCEFCESENATVRNRPRYGEAPIALCDACWADLQAATRGPRLEE